jgi:hypothetical protein
VGRQVHVLYDAGNFRPVPVSIPVSARSPVNSETTRQSVLWEESYV